MKKERIALLSAVLFLSSQMIAQTNKAKEKTVTVYTTAKNSDLRISQNGTLQFKEFKQPLETQPCIFVDPSHTYQTFIGIGGALTDASAETFAKLPPSTQNELL